MMPCPLSFSNGVEVAASTLSAAATPFQPGVDKKTEEDKEAGELVTISYSFLLTLSAGHR